MRPPWPPGPAPRASNWPCAVVRPPSRVTSLHSTTLPPSPCVVALASMRALPSMSTVVAAYSPSPPCQPPPTRTRPPPVAPLASSRVWSCNRRSSPSKVIDPP